MCVTGMYDSNISETVTVLEPIPFLHLNSVLGEIKFIGKTSSGSQSRIGTGLAAAAWTPGLLKHGKEEDINHFHVFLAHAHASVLETTAKQHGIRLAAELVSCSTCSRAEGKQGTHSSSRDEASKATAGMCPHRHPWTLSNFSQGVAVRRDVCRHRPLDAREKTAAAILSVVKRFVVDTRVPRGLRTDNDTECSNNMFMDFCNGLGIRRKFRTPQRHSRMEPSRA